MLGNAKALKRNNWECKGILIGPLMAPRFSRPPRFRHSVFHTLSKWRSRPRAQIPRRGWQADVTSRMCQTRTGSLARASFVRDLFDYVEASQDPDAHGTTSTVTAFLAGIRIFSEHAVTRHQARGVPFRIIPTPLGCHGRSVSSLKGRAVEPPLLVQRAGGFQALQAGFLCRTFHTSRGRTSAEHLHS